MRNYIVVVLLFIPVVIFTQNTNTDLNYFLPNDVTYNQNIPTPKSVIGHEVGEWHITHDKLVQYMYALDVASDRISIEDRGTTFEGRPLLLLTITSPSNHKNIKSIQEEHMALTESKAGNMNITNMPVVVYQGRGHLRQIHL